MIVFDNVGKIYLDNIYPITDRFILNDINIMVYPFDFNGGQCGVGKSNIIFGPGWYDTNWSHYDWLCNSGNTTMTGGGKTNTKGLYDTWYVNRVQPGSPYINKPFAYEYTTGLTYNGYTDWFLPSQGDLIAMKPYAVQVGMDVTPYTGSIRTHTYFSSSISCASNWRYSLFVAMGNTETYDNTLVISYYDNCDQPKVRPIRYIN